MLDGVEDSSHNAGDKAFTGVLTRPAVTCSDQPGDADREMADNS